MKLAKHSVQILAALGFTFCFIPGLLAQSNPAPQRAPKTKTVSPVPPPAANGAASSVANNPPVPTAKRDPFLPLIAEKKEGGSLQHLPPGKAGLVISTVRVDGTVRSQDGMIAMVSNPEQHVYFIREGDHLYDGDVEKIGLDGVTFRENSKDAFGRTVERVVTKRIYASAGEQQ